MSRRRQPSKKSTDDFIDSDGPDLSDGDNSLSELATGLRGNKKQKTTQNNEDVRTKILREETPEERRLRMAREYLTSVGVSIDSDAEDEVLVEGTDEDDEGFGNDLVAKQLRLQTLQLQGKEKRYSVVDNMNFDHMLDFTPLLHCPTAAGSNDVPLFKETPTWTSNGHRFYITSTALTDDNTFAISTSHGGSINKHDIQTGQVTRISLGIAKGQKGHKGAIWGSSVSSDNVYLATAGEDRSVRVWDLRSNQQVHRFNKHLKPATCCKFLKNSLTLFSSGYDRDIHSYDCEKMVYMESFFGPSAPTITMDCLYQNRVFVAGEDCVARIIKPEFETTIALPGSKGDLLSIDCLAALDHDNLVVGSQTNTLQLWNSQKKKARDTVRNAHAGSTLSHLGTKRFGEAVQTLSTPVENWIISLSALYPSDLVFSGSNDGYIRAWNAHIDHEQLHPLFNIPVQGFVNSLQVGKEGRFVLAAVGKNHRLGTWQGHITDNVKEGLYMYDLSSIYQNTGNDNDLADETDDTSDSE